ncbi:MAG: tRNA (guanosine(46)-N7)-methyltransferase TrmB [Lachnospiraceae bacterium]|nr:tRNA (guanosine(46)-N7)-methyltransferase TrmB [Lachnospiraceae bacterium]
MRLKNVPGSREAVAANDAVIKDPGSVKGTWAENIFRNTNPIHIEVGMGKGKFISYLARENPGINYVGIEKYSSVLIRALQKNEEDPCPNLRFIRMDAEDIEDVFGKGEVDKIYLNFSDPWPKDRHAKRRLTSGRFLGRFAEILTDGGTIEFKTDNRTLFEYSLGELEPAGWTLLASTFDLHNDETLSQGNIMTEYEEKFSSAGNPICKYIIGKNAHRTAGET